MDSLSLRAAPLAMSVSQDALVLLLVAAAVGYLVWTAWRMVARKKKPGCGSCSTCSSPPPASGAMIPLERLNQSASELSQSHQRSSRRQP